MINLRNTRHEDLEVSTWQLGTSSTPPHLLGDVHAETLGLCPRRCFALCAHLKERADGSRWPVVCAETSLNYIIQPCSYHPPELWFGDFIFTVFCYFGFTKEKCLFSFVCLFVWTSMLLPNAMTDWAGQRTTCRPASGFEKKTWACSAPPGSWADGALLR